MTADRVIPLCGQLPNYLVLCWYFDNFALSPRFPLIGFLIFADPLSNMQLHVSKILLTNRIYTMKHSYHPFVNWCIWNQPDKSFKLFSILAAYIFHHVFWANFPALLCVPFIVRDLIFSWDNHRGADSKFSERVFRNLKYALENSFEVNWTYFIIGNVLYFREQRCPANHKWASVMSIR